MSQLLRFCLVGSVGFAIDAGIVQALVVVWQANPYLVRVVAILVAATATWFMNRHYTFQVSCRASRSEWSRYVSLMMLGALVNYTVFAVCIALWQEALVQPIWAVAAGSIAGLGINFTTSRFWVFNSA